MFKAIWKASRVVSHGEQRYFHYRAPLALLDQSNASPLKFETFRRISRCSQTWIHGGQVLAVFLFRGLGEVPAILIFSELL